MSGQKLMKEIRARYPDLTIEELLDQVRTEQIRDYANRLKIIRTNSVLELLEEAVPWDLAQEDIQKLLRIMIVEFSTEIAEEAHGLLESGIYWNIYIFIMKTRTLPEQPKCFFRPCNWPWCSRSSNTEGTRRPRPASRS